MFAQVSAQYETDKFIVNELLQIQKFRGRRISLQLGRFRRFILFRYDRYIRAPRKIGGRIQVFQRNRRIFILWTKKVLQRAPK